MVILEVDTKIEAENPKWWKFTKKNKKILLWLLSIISIFYISKAILLLKISGLIFQVNRENLPSFVQQNRITFSQNNKIVDGNLKCPPVILKSIVEKKLSIDTKPQFTSRAM